MKKTVKLYLILAITISLLLTGCAEHKVNNNISNNVESTVNDDKSEIEEVEDNQLKEDETVVKEDMGSEESESKDNDEEDKEKKVDDKQGEEDKEKKIDDKQDEKDEYGRDVQALDIKVANEELVALLPAEIGYKWEYSGSFEYEHSATLTAIEKNEEEFIYKISGEVVKYFEEDLNYVDIDGIGDDEGEIKGLTDGLENNQNNDEQQSREDGQDSLDNNENTFENSDINMINSDENATIANTKEIGNEEDEAYELDNSIEIEYVIENGVLTQKKDSVAMMDSYFDELILIMAPLEEGTTWVQTIQDDEGKEYNIKGKIIWKRVKDGKTLYTVTYKDVNGDYYEERVIEEGVGVVEFYSKYPLDGMLMRYGYSLETMHNEECTIKR